MSAVDMSQFIAAKSDQVNADDLLSGPITIKITGVSASPDSAEQPISVHFEGDDNKPYKPCKTCRRIMVHVWGPEASKYVGRQMTLYRDEKVMFGGIQVGGIRISHMSHIERETTVALLVKRSQRRPYTVKPLRHDQARQSERDGEEFPGDQVSEAVVWSEAQHRRLADAASLADIDAMVSDPNANEMFARLQREAPDRAKALNAAIKGKRKALASRERD